MRLFQSLGALSIYRFDGVIARIPFLRDIMRVGFIECFGS
jgi:hypothetical protein